MKLLFASIVSVILCSCRAEEYHGKLIGPIQELYHSVKGTVYAVDSEKLKILNFTYDGQGPDAFFYIGLKQNATRDTPSPEGIKIPDEKGSGKVLKEYKNVDLTLTLPKGVKIQDIKWLSVWCVAFSADFGHIIIPNDIDPPRPQTLGAFLMTAHGVRSGNITVLDTKTIVIPNFEYDGQGPDGFFWVGTGPFPSHNGSKVPDENGRLAKLNAYTGQTITLRLPGDLTFHSLQWLSVWCVLFGVNFGHIQIPLALNVPPSAPKVDISVQNCEPLASNLQVTWEIDPTNVTIELKGQIENGDYMAFGPSGSDTTTVMTGADVVVTWYEEQSGPKAVDYYITQYSQCSSGNGVCPDTSIANGKDTVMVVSGGRANGITAVRYTRPLVSGDPSDSTIIVDREMSLAWAIGPLSIDKLALRHTSRTPGNLKINFGRTPVNNCPEFQTVKPATEPKKPWVAQTLSGDKVNIFTARLGPTGGKRGYEGITGRPSWGIAWYINSILIPELVLKRGETYVFIVNGGANETDQANYHPFYITDDPAGGYIQYSQPEQKQKYKIFPGRSPLGGTVDYQVGRLCEWQLKTGAPQDAETFADFMKNLFLKCYRGRPGVLIWSPDKNTPDTVYYQCYTHKYLGWKIHIVDEFPGAQTKVATKISPVKQSSSGPTQASPTTTIVQVTTTAQGVTLEPSTRLTDTPNTRLRTGTTPTSTNSALITSAAPSSQSRTPATTNSQSITYVLPSSLLTSITVLSPFATSSSAPSPQSIATVARSFQPTASSSQLAIAPSSLSLVAPSSQSTATDAQNSQSTTLVVPSFQSTAFVATSSQPAVTPSFQSVIAPSSQSPATDAQNSQSTTLVVPSFQPTGFVATSSQPAVTPNFQTLSTPTDAQSSQSSSRRPTTIVSIPEQSTASAVQNFQSTSSPSSL